MIVMANPMQFTIVSDVPLDASGAFCATRVEKSGESAITTRPQKRRKEINSTTEEEAKNNGDSRQQSRERLSDKVAILFTPKRCDRSPLTTQAKAPAAITKKDNRDTGRSCFG
jgi:hypothetical protein